MTKKEEGRPYRHGDILLVPVDDIPARAKQRQVREAAVLAEGEATGHAHVLRGPALEIWDFSGKVYARLPEGGSISHEMLPISPLLPVSFMEHGIYPLPARMYEIVRQRVYTPEKIRNVAD